MSDKGKDDESNVSIIELVSKEEECCDLIEKCVTHYAKYEETQHMEEENKNKSNTKEILIEKAGKLKEKEEEIEKKKEEELILEKEEIDKMERCDQC